MNTDLTPDSPKAVRWAAVALAIALGALVAASCGPEQQQVCSGERERLVVVPSTSKTDYDVSLTLTPTVGRRAAERAAASCGWITVGIQDGRPQANLELTSKRLRLELEDEEAFNPDSFIRRLTEEGNSHVEKELIGPLEATEPTGGSPFFQTLVEIGDELQAHSWENVTIALIGDGLVVERVPSSGEMIDFANDGVSPRAAAGFVKPLERLEGSCVILVGAGATSKLPADRIRASQEALQWSLEQAGADFVAVRSPVLPRCA